MFLFYLLAVIWRLWFWTINASNNYRKDHVAWVLATGRALHHVAWVLATGRALHHVAWVLATGRALHHVAWVLATGRALASCLASTGSSNVCAGSSNFYLKCLSENGSSSLSPFSPPPPPLSSSHGLEYRL